LIVFKVPVEAVQAYRSSRGSAPLIPNLATRWEWSNSRHSRLNPCESSSKHEI